jgi:hypothetical protein
MVSVMTSVSSAGSASEISPKDTAGAGWENQNIESQNNNWRTDSKTGETKLTTDEYNTILKDMVSKISVEMMKQQNPTDKDKFKINDDE